MIKRFDKMWLGATIGFIIPLAVLIVIYFEEHILDSIWVFFGDLYSHRLMSAFLRIGLIGNLAIFLLTFNTGFTQLPRGILMTTIIYGMFIVYMYIW